MGKRLSHLSHEANCLRLFLARVWQLTILGYSQNHTFNSYNTPRREDIHPLRLKLNLGKRTYSGAILLNSLPETYKRAASLKACK